jgi:hypothetical protein
MKNIEEIEIKLQGVDGCVLFCEYIGQHYEKHCISADSGNLLNVIPVKILECVLDLNGLENKKYIEDLEFIHLDIVSPDQPLINNWDRYKEIFDKIIQLKAVSFECADENFLTPWFFESLENESQSIWNARIAYFQSRSISIVAPHEIHDNNDLRTKLAKEAGISWKFHFHSLYI